MLYSLDVNNVVRDGKRKLRSARDNDVVLKRKYGKAKRKQTYLRYEIFKDVYYNIVTKMLVSCNIIENVKQILILRAHLITYFLKTQ